MKKFIIKVSAFTVITIGLFIVFLFLLPPTPRATGSHLFGAIKKDSLLLNVPSSRIIFIGGSNLSFGLNSQTIKDSLELNPINTAIHAGIGIKYMLENTLQYVQKGDIIVLIPEYQHFYRKWHHGSEELLRTILEINKSKIKLLSLNQIFNCIPFTGNLVLSKLDNFEYIPVEDSKTGIYEVNSFNRYGDAYLHWDMQRIDSFEPDTIMIIDEYNPKVMQEIKKYNQKFQEKGTTLFISYPSYQDISFFNSEKAIKKIEQEYITSGLIILGTPERYRMPDSLMFDTPYHLNKTGVDYRTKLLIEDIRKHIAPN
ncbi:MAG: hypothetical protein LBG15_10390 [Dysgonamonadaceae bacterium]|jgi:hypothetical protein|nr:hypothetical protein [Dysgonamonadaceae bacterium]